MNQTIFVVSILASVGFALFVIWDVFQKRNFGREDAYAILGVLISISLAFAYAPEIGEVEQVIEEVQPELINQSIELFYEAKESGYITGENFVVSGVNEVPQAYHGPNDASDLVVRGFLSFDLTDIPEGVEIESAKLIIPRSRYNGNSPEPETFPIDVVGSLIFDNVSYGNNLNESAFDVQANSRLLRTGKYFDEVVVTTSLKEEYSENKSRYQVRFQFEYEVARVDSPQEYSSGTYMIFANDESGIPKLEVIYKQLE